MLNTDESVFSRNIRTMYSRRNNGTMQPSKNNLFNGSISIMSTISISDKVFNAIKEGAIRSNDFIKYIRQIIKYMKNDMNIETGKWTHNW